MATSTRIDDDDGFQLPKHIEAAIESEPRVTRIFIVVYYENGVWLFSSPPIPYIVGQRIPNFDKVTVWQNFLDERRNYHKGKMPDQYRIVSIEVPIVKPTMIYGEGNSDLQR